jgi:hypothetical protein
MRSLVVASIVFIAACSDVEPPDGMDPAGPPEILQVFVRERVPVIDDDGYEVVGLQSRIAFGDHEDIDPDADDRQVDAAVARDGQRIRVVVDELLRGNNLEEIPCADGSWSRVPVGTDFDDVARCAGADLSDCEDLCIGADGPVGILDANGDGAFDDTRLIEGAVVLTCDDVEVPLDAQRSYYQPTGGQQLSTATVGTDSLGPAVVLVPGGGIRPGATCGLRFAAAVVDKQGVEVCAPSGGGCEPGDTSGVGFAVEPFALVASDPPDGAIDVELTAPDSPDARVAILTNAALDPDTLATAVTLTADGVAVAEAIAAVDPEDDATVVVTVPGGFLAGTAYAVTVTGGSSGLSDIYDDTLADDVTFGWTTAASDSKRGRGAR